MLGHPPLQLQQLADQGGHRAQHRHVVGERALAPAQPMHRQHAAEAALAGNRHRDERRALLGRLALALDIVDDLRLAAFHHLAGRPFAEAVAAVLDFRRGQSIGITDRQRPAVRVGQHHAPAVQAQQLGDQMQQLADDQAGVEALAEQPRRFA